VLGNRMVKTFDDYVQALCVADHECNGQTKLSLHTVRIAIASRDKKNSIQDSRISTENNSIHYLPLNYRH